MCLPLLSALWGFLGRILAGHVKQQLRAQLLDLERCGKTQTPKEAQAEKQLGKEAICFCDCELGSEKLGSENYGR